MLWQHIGQYGCSTLCGLLPALLPLLQIPCLLLPVHSWRSAFLLGRCCNENLISWLINWLTDWQCSTVQRQCWSADYSTPPLLSLSVLANTSTPHPFFATSSIVCQCLRGYSSKLLHWLLTPSEAVALPVQSLTIEAVLVSAQPSAAICSFHEPEQLGLVGGASSSQLQLSGTHCRFTFAPRPSVTVSFKLGPRLLNFSDCSLSLTFPLRTIEELNWTELNWWCRRAT